MAIATFEAGGIYRCNNPRFGEIEVIKHNRATIYYRRPGDVSSCIRARLFVQDQSEAIADDCGVYMASGYVRQAEQAPASDPVRFEAGQTYCYRSYYDGYTTDYVMRVTSRTACTITYQIGQVDDDGVRWDTTQQTRRPTLSSTGGTPEEIVKSSQDSSGLFWQATNTYTAPQLAPVYDFRTGRKIG